MSDASEAGLLPEDELRGLFAPERPDPRAFEAAVRARIAEREARGEEPAQPPSRLVRWAAGILPPDVGLAVLAKPSGVLTTLALPVLVLASSFGVFFAGKRSIERSAAEAAPPSAREARPRRWLSMSTVDSPWGPTIRIAQQYGFLAVLFAPLVLGGAHSFDIVALLLLGAMGLLALEVRRMARAGWMQRGSIAQMCCGLLATVYTTCFLWAGTFSLVEPASTLGVQWSAGAMLVAISACAFVVWRERAAPAASAILVVLWCAFIFVVLTPITSPDSPRYLRRVLTTYGTDTNNLQGWAELGHAGEALLATGEPLPDLAHVRSAVERAIDGGAEAHPFVWTAAGRLGLIDREHWHELGARKMERYALDRLLQGEGPLNMVPYKEYSFHLLLATRELTQQEREHLARRVEAEWPREPVHGRLEKAALCMRLWALLGSQDRIDAHRGSARELLVEHWIGGGERRLFARIGGFTSNPQKFRTSFDDTTYAAVSLMARVGIPDGIDPFLLRGHVRAEAERFSLWFAGFSHLQSDSHAAWLRLEREIGLPERSWLERLAAERVLIATLLTLLLVVLALRAAPSRAALVYTQPSAPCSPSSTT
ncbi:MAG: hypothetical protein FJ299_08750 [Planctomycetes bacterium]|nr:hypothetical protein [Planctomycetota bacterium]